jgi:hypothetical protein
MAYPGWSLEELKRHRAAYPIDRNDCGRATYATAPPVNLVTAAGSTTPAETAVVCPNHRTRADPEPPHQPSLQAARSPPHFSSAHPFDDPPGTSRTDVSAVCSVGETRRG